MHFMFELDHTHSKKNGDLKVVWKKKKEHLMHCLEYSANLWQIVLLAIAISVSDHGQFAKFFTGQLLV